MVIHELATNAAKHGALSNQEGCVDIEWQMENGTADKCFSISWTERGGPTVIPPPQRGYGSTVIKDMAELSLDGEVLAEFCAFGPVLAADVPGPRNSARCGSNVPGWLTTRDLT